MDDGRDQPATLPVRIISANCPSACSMTTWGDARIGAGHPPQTIGRARRFPDRVRYHRVWIVRPGTGMTAKLHRLQRDQGWAWLGLLSFSLRRFPRLLDG